MINLLPPQQIQKIRLLKLGRWSRGILLLMGIMAALLPGSLFCFNVLLKTELKKVEQESQRAAVEEKIGDLERFEQEVGRNHDYIKQAKRIQKQQQERFKWSAALKELAGLTAGDVSLDEFTTNEEITEIKLTGVAETRQSVLDLEEGLKQSDFYQEIVAPVSNLTAKENVNFEFTLRLGNEKSDKK